MIDRRRLLQSGLGAGAASAALAGPFLKLNGQPATSRRASAMAELGRGGETAPAEGVRKLALRNLHTDERLEAVYFDQGRYVPDALAAVNKVLRDFRTGEVHPIAPRLLDVLADLRARTGSRAPFQVVSGYRSAKTNAMLHERSAEVARRSLHMDGMAIDLYLEDVALDRLRLAALTLGRGGVGYYPVSSFVHVDVGPVRRWIGA